MFKNIYGYKLIDRRGPPIRRTFDKNHGTFKKLNKGYMPTKKTYRARK